LSALELTLKNGAFCPRFRKMDLRTGGILACFLQFPRKILGVKDSLAKYCGEAAYPRARGIPRFEDREMWGARPAPSSVKLSKSECSLDYDVLNCSRRRNEVKSEAGKKI
jgi:hypothetical protein